MPDHDELCPQRHQYRGHKSRCVCALLAAARADERERIAQAIEAQATTQECMRTTGPATFTFHDQFCGHADGGACICTQLLAARIDERGRQLTGVIDRSFIGRDFAEAVAARLVEVICEQAADLAAHESAATNLLTAWRNTRTERDAARAEVAALSAEINRMVGELSSIRMEHEAEVAALTRWKDEATEVIKEWERIHTLLGKPGFIGESKAVVTYDEVRDLLEARGDLRAARAEVAALREEVEAISDEAADLRTEVDMLREQVRTGAW